MKLSYYQSSPLNYGCFTNTTMISIGRHQISDELVVRASTFLNTTFFIPLGSPLYPMLVCTLTNTKNGFLGSAITVVEGVFRMNGFYLLAMEDLASSPTWNSRGRSSGLKSGMRTSEVMALLTTSRIIFREVTVSQSIFLHSTLGRNDLAMSLTLCSMPSSLMVSSPLYSVLCCTSLGQQKRKISVFLPGFSTTFNSSQHQLVDVLTKKKPFARLREFRVRVRKAGQSESRGRMAQQQLPLIAVPKSTTVGILSELAFFI